MEDFLGIILAVVASFGVASMSLCIRNGTINGSAHHALVVVLSVNVCTVIPLATILHYPNYQLTRTSIAAFVVAGIIGTMVGRALYYDGITRIGSSRADPIKATIPLHATIIAILALGESPTRPHVLGILLIIVGAVTISWESVQGPKVGSHQLTLVGLAITLSAAFFFGLEPIFAKYGLNQGTPFLVGLALKTTAAAIGFLTYLRWRSAIPTRADLVSNSTSMKWYLGAGIGNTIFILAYYAALEIAPVVLVVPIVHASPLLVIAASYLFFQHLERVTIPIVGGALFIVSGAILVTLFG